MNINFQKHGINRSFLDETVSPENDFYQFACGGWIKQNPMPDEFSSYGQFNVLQEKTRKQVQELILNLSKDPSSKEKGSIAQKISDLYNMGMDEKRLNAEGALPIIPTLNEMRKRLKEDSLESLLAWLHLGLDGTFFSSGVGPDPADSNTNILHIGEAGIVLGDRDYYLEVNETNKKIMKAYEEYAKKIMMLCGYDEENATKVWETLIKIETALAKIKMTREQRRDPRLHYNTYSIERLQKEFNFINWKEYFNYLNLKEVEWVNVSSVEYMKALPELISSLSQMDLNRYLTFSLISNSSGLMSDAFIDANFEMFGKVMNGQKEKKPRWKRAMGIPNSMFGEAVGELYVKKHFSPESKEYMKGLVENLRIALDQHLTSVSWMSDETKAKAREKLSVMGVKIGYPDKWKDYTEIEIDTEKSYLENVQKASVWFTKDNYSKFNKPVDKTEWHMLPQTVNAYYSPIVNEICFPAGILQPPFFDFMADDALNYGAIGVVIGHEMTHGFDDQGRQYDKDGNLTDWWMARDAEKFNKLADILVKQFDEVEIAPGVHANGRFTLGENIADQGGISISLTAYNSSNSPKTYIDGFSPLQRFFIAFATVWAGSISEEEKLTRTKTDPHSLAKNRVNVTLKNIDEFENAFDIKPDSPMFLPKKDRVIIW